MRIMISRECRNVESMSGEKSGARRRHNDTQYTEGTAPLGSGSTRIPGVPSGQARLVSQPRFFFPFFPLVPVVIPVAALTDDATGDGARATEGIGVGSISASGVVGRRGDLHTQTHKTHSKKSASVHTLNTHRQFTLTAGSSQAG